MQCPTCGSNTPGTLGTCSNCDAPIDVYSVGPAVPLGAPVGEAPADALGERTMMVPPPATSWAPSSDPLVPSSDPLAALYDPLAPAPPSTGAAQPGAAQPGAAQWGVAQWEAAQPEAQQQGAPQQGAPQQGSTPPAGMLPPADSESTAAWTFDPDADPPTPAAGTAMTGTGGFGAVPPPSPWTSDQPSGGAFASPAREPSAFGAGPEPERTASIVPESWFAQPRKPQEPEAEPTQVWAPQTPQADQGWGAQPGMGDALDAATQIAPAPMMNPGMPAEHGTRLDFNPNFDQTRMDQGGGMGGPMGAPPMGAPPMGGAPMGPGGPIGPGMAPMGPGGPLGPGGMGQGAAYPGFPGQAPPRSGGRTSKPLLIAVSALVVVALVTVVIVMWPSGGDKNKGATSKTPPSGKTKVAQTNKLLSATRQQAGAMNDVLNASSGTRRILAGALGRARTCEQLPAAIQGFQTVARQRQNQLQRAQGLKVDKLAGGERLRATLRQSLQASLEVDQSLLRWAEQNQRKCKGKPRPDASRAPGRAAWERRATLTKRQFVAQWNPVARSNGLPPRTWQQV